MRVQTFENGICQHFPGRHFIGLAGILKHPAIHLRTGDLTAAAAAGLLYGPENVPAVDKDGR